MRAAWGHEMAGRYWRWVWAICAVLILSVSGLVWLAHAGTDRPWAWRQAGCRYAEIDNPTGREFVQAVAGVLWSPESCAGVYYDRGEFNWKQKWWDKATRDYGFGLRLTPDDLSLRNSHAMAAMASNQFAAAVQDYNIILRHDPSDTQAFTSRGESRETLGDWQGAIADYTAAIRTSPQSADVYIYRGRAYTLTGRLDDGIADLTKGLDISPDDLSSNIWLYIALRKAGKDAQTSLRTRTASLDLKPWPGAAIQYYLGQLPADTLEKIGFEDPNNRVWRQECDAWFYLGEDALARGDKDKARELFHKTTANCDSVDYEWGAAQLELKQLGK